MKIDSFKSLEIGPSGTPSAKTAVKAEKPAEDAPVAAVRLSAASAALTAQDPAVDMARVQEIRRAIAEGRFEINAAAIADRLISTARELLGTPSKA
jgi:negative regulator of flagellin synthesis FlgM